MGKYILITVAIYLTSCARHVELGTVEEGKSKTIHSATCPRECSRCEGIIRDTLAFLVRGQERDGHWRGGNDPNHYEMTTTALSCLAFLAEGSTRQVGQYKEPLKKATDWIIKNIDKEWRTWEYAFAAIFLVELYRKEPSNELKKAMRSILQILTSYRQRKYGGWGHSGKIVYAYPATMVAATNWAYLALLELDEIGLKVNDKDLKINRYYLKTMDHKGGLIYGYPTSHGGPEPGRTAGALYNLFRSKQTDSEVYKKGLPYVRKYLEKGTIVGMGGAARLF